MFMSSFTKLYFSTILGFFLSVSILNFSKAEGHEHGEVKEKFNAGEAIMHHIGDEHQWHFATIGDTHLAIPLPVILYSEKNGIQAFSASHFYHSPDGTHEGYKMEHEHITALDGSKVYDFSITKNVASLILSVIILLAIFLTDRKSVV